MRFKYHCGGPVYFQFLPFSHESKVILTLINTAPFGTLNTLGVVPIMLHTLLCLLVAHSNWVPEWLVGSLLFSLLNCWGCRKKGVTLYVILTHLQWSDPKIFFARSWLTLYEWRISKKLGSFHSKSWFLGLRIPHLDRKSAREAFFEGLKNYFLSDKTPIFLKFSDHKKLIKT